MTSCSSKRAGASSARKTAVRAHDSGASRAHRIQRNDRHVGHRSADGSRALFKNDLPDGGVTATRDRRRRARSSGTSRYGLFLVSPIDGRVIDGFETGSGFSQVPTAYGTRVFAMSNAGVVFGIQVATPDVR